MTTTRERQDQSYREGGFYADKDYEVPTFSPEDWRSLYKVRDLARETEPKDAFLTELAKANSGYSIERVYRIFGQQLVDLVHQLREAGKTDLPSDELFDRLDVDLRYEGIKDWIIIDGGEIRESTAYEEDGETVKKGFKRLYWK